MRTGKCREQGRTGERVLEAEVTQKIKVKGQCHVGQKRIEISLFF